MAIDPPLETLVKIRPLHEIDLARIAPLARDEKRKRLVQLRASKSVFSYDPVRRSLSDILNVSLDLFGPVPSPP